MRQRYLLVLVGVVVALLALGALPSLLASGAPYYVTAEVVGDENATTPEGVGGAFEASNVSERRYPYVLAAIDRGRSDAYYEGPFGVKEAFSHSPFDELGAIETRTPAAVDPSPASAVAVAYVRYDGTLYRIEIVRGER
jgi:hypothetical protein